MSEGTKQTGCSTSLVALSSGRSAEAPQTGSKGSAFVDSGASGKSNNTSDNNQKPFAGLLHEDEADPEMTELLTLIAINQTHLDLIDRIIAKAETALAENRQLQENLKKKQRDRKKTNKKREEEEEGEFVRPKQQLQYHRCYPPYFKDSAGMVPARNSEAIAIDKICLADPLIREDRPWTKRELERLSSAVRESVVTHQSVPLNGKKAILLAKLKASGQETNEGQKKKWRDEVGTINRRLIYLNNRSDAQVFATIKDHDYSFVDWAKIHVQDFHGMRSIAQLRSKWCNEQNPKWWAKDQKWSAEEDERLFELATAEPEEEDFAATELDLDREQQQNPESLGPDWDQISAKLDIGRTPYQCFERFTYLCLTNASKKPWSAEEDKRLLELIERFTVQGEIAWNTIATYMPGRTREQCEYRYTRRIAPKIRHGRWTMAEDVELLRAINKYGPQNWVKIGQCMKTRTGNQCRDRWVFVLDTKRKTSPWTWEEFQRLFFGIRLFSRDRCSKIAMLLPGRNNMDCRMAIRMLLRHKINALLENDESRLQLNHFAINADYVNRRRETTMHHFSAITKQEAATHQFVSKIGLGQFVITTEGIKLDYSKVKQNRMSDYDDFIIKTSGRWNKSSKSPNEYDEEELIAELNKLPEDTRNEAIAWLMESDNRLREEEKLIAERCPTDSVVGAKEFFQQEMFTDERLRELYALVDELLPIRPLDMKQYRNEKWDPVRYLAQTQAKREQRAADRALRQAMKSGDDVKDAKKTSKTGKGKGKTRGKKSAGPKRSAAKKPTKRASKGKKIEENSNDQEQGSSQILHDFFDVNDNNDGFEGEGNGEEELEESEQWYRDEQDEEELTEDDDDSEKNQEYQEEEEEGSEEDEETLLREYLASVGKNCEVRKKSTPKLFGVAAALSGEDDEEQQIELLRDDGRIPKNKSEGRTSQKRSAVSANRRSLRTTFRGRKTTEEGKTGALSRQNNTPKNAVKKNKKGKNGKFYNPDFDGDHGEEEDPHIDVVEGDDFGAGERGFDEDEAASEHPWMSQGPAMMAAFDAELRAKMMTQLEEGMTQKGFYTPEEQRLCLLFNMCNYVRQCNELKFREKCQQLGPTLLRERVRHYVENVFAAACNDENERGKLPRSRLRSASSSTSANGTRISNLVRHLLPPSPAMMNCIDLFRRGTRLDLINKAAQYFDPVITSEEIAEMQSTSPGQPCIYTLKSCDQLNICLSAAIRSQPEYIDLKKRMYSCFFLPLVMERALTSPQTDADLRTRLLKRGALFQPKQTQLPISSNSAFATHPVKQQGPSSSGAGAAAAAVSSSTIAPPQTPTSSSSFAAVTPRGKSKKGEKERESAARTATGGNGRGRKRPAGTTEQTGEAAAEQTLGDYIRRNKHLILQKYHQQEQQESSEADGVEQGGGNSNE